MSKIARLKIALLQLNVGKDKIKNVENAVYRIKNAVETHKPRIVALPECFNSPYGTKFFPEYAETIPDGYTSKVLSDVAKEHGIFLIGGTIPEKSGDKLYNSCTVWSPTGTLMATHRKVHLFDIDIPGGVRFKESDVLSPGDKLTTIEVDDIKIGLGICYDIRFEEMSRIYKNEGCKMLIFPAAFNMTTGPLHWELLQRGRANDNQLYVATISVARSKDAGYVAWAHSMIVDPWGKVICSAGEEEETIVADLDFSLVDKVRAQIPTTIQRRTDLYNTERKKL